VTPNDLLTLAIEPALSLLPERMNSPAAKAMTVAIALQESDLRYRRQVPVAHARGFWQFERIGVEGVMTHPATRAHARNLCATLVYPPSAVYEVIDDNDVLAAGFARLLLWSVPQALPGRMDVDEAWKQYISSWRPGKPRREKWASNYRLGWGAVASS
jgi:hypothetical protein